MNNILFYLTSTEVRVMKGKVAVIIVIMFIVVFLAFAWFLLQHVIAEYELERPTSIINGLH